MKKIFIFILTLIFALTLVSCNKKITINFNTNQDSIVFEPLVIEKNQEVDLSEYTTKMVVDGYVFKGWYLDKGFNEYVRSLDSATQDITLYAKWVKVHTVNFNTADGSTVSSQSVEDGKLATEPENDPTRTGYLFDGWFEDSECKNSFDFYGEIHSDTTIYAKWLKSCHITFVTDGSSVTDLEFVSGGTVVQINQVSTKTGYDFDGWFKDAALTTVITNTQGLTDNTSVYAKFTPHTYTLTYDRNGGTGTNERVSATYDVDITLKNCEYTKTGYTFKEWNTKADGTGSSYNPGDSVKSLTDEARGEVSLYAIYTPNTYTIAFNANGGTGSMNSLTATYDTDVTLSTNTFEKVGYNFIGWSKNQNDIDFMYAPSATVKNLAVEGTVTLYAIYEECEYQITFDKNNANATGTVNPLTIKYTETKELPSAAFALYGYTFKEWNTKADGTGTSYLNEANVSGSIGNTTLYAIYQAKEVTVSFVLGTGVTPVDSVKVNFDGTYTNLPTPTRTGYSFDGYYLEEELTTKVTSETKVTKAENHSLYAKWAKNAYTIAFNANGGTGNMDSITATYDTDVTLSTNTFAKVGYNFIGWSKNQNDTDFMYAPNATVKNLAAEGTVTLYAIYEECEYQITFDKNNANATGTVNSLTIKYTETKELPSAAFTLYGYTFKEWNTKADGTGTSYANEANVSGSIGNTTLYAIYQAKEVTVSFVLGTGATPVDSVKVNFDGTYSNLPTPSRTGYSFDGYYLEENLTTKVTSETKVTKAENHSLYAKWSPLSFTIKFDKNSDTAVGTMNDLTFVYPSDAKLTKSTLTNEGMFFQGWSTTKTGGVEYHDEADISSIRVSNDNLTVTLYAVWFNGYTISFNTDGGTPVQSITQVIGGEITKPADPTKTGYTFKGWLDGNTLVEAFPTTMMEGGKNYKASWEAITYQVKFDKNNENATGTMENLSIKYDESKALTANAYELAHYNFIGWALTVNGEVAYTDGATVLNLADENGKVVTLYAIYEETTKTIIYDKNDQNATGSVNNTVIEKAHSGVLRNNGYSLKGHSFKEWNTKADGTGTAYTEGATIETYETELTLYAIWTKNSYTVSFNTNGGSNVADETIKYGDHYVLANTPTKAGYTFKEWNTKADGTGTTITTESTYTLESAQTLYAIYNANKYYVVFDKNNENATGTMQNQELTYGVTSALSKNTYKLTNYEFASWNTKADGTGTTYTDEQEVLNLLESGNITLYAIYEETTKTIIYDKNNENATGSVNNTVIEKAHSGVVKNNGYSLKGHSFKEWNTKADGTGTAYTEGATIETYETELTLYAIWTKNSYTVSFNTNGGSNVADETIKYGDHYVLANTPTKAGYTFKEWNTKADGTGTTITTDSTYSLESAQTLYAIYDANKYYVVFDKNNENATGTMENQELTYGVTSALSKNTYKLTNYEFASWNTKADGTGTTYTDEQEVLNLLESGNITLYAIYDQLVITVRIVAIVDGEIMETKYEYEVGAGTNIVYGQAYNVNEVILSQVGNDLSHEIPNKSFKGMYTSTQLNSLLEESQVYNENNNNTYSIYAYFATEVTFDLSEGGYDNVTVNLHEANNHNVLNLLPNVSEKEGYIYFFLVGPDDEEVNENKTITVKFYKNDPYSLYVAGVTKSELPSSGGYKYEVTIDDVTYTSYYVYSGIYSFSLEDVEVLCSSSDKFNNSSISYNDSYARLTFNPQVGGYALVKGTKDLALKYYQLHISQLTSGFSLSSGYYDYEHLSMETSKYLNKEKGIYSANPYQVGSDNIYKLRFNILDSNSVPIESADFNKTYTAKLLGENAEAEKVNLVSVQHQAKDILVGTISYNGIEYGIDENEDGTLEVVYFYVLNSNDSDDDTTYDRIKFTASAVGKRFEIVIKPMNTGNSQNDEASATLMAYINNGLNVESHEELKDAYANYMIDESDVSPIINIHSKILSKLDPSQLYLGSPINVSSGYDQAKIHQIGATLEDGMNNTGSVYIRAVHSSEIYNNNLTINGNFFVIDGSELPVVQLDANGNGLSSSQADNNNGTFFNENSKYKGKYIKNIQIGIFHEYLTYMVGYNYIGYKQINNSVTYNNMNIISNTITPVVNFQDPAAAQDEQVEIALRNSGGYNGIMARRCKIETNNVVLDYCGIGLTASFDGASIDAKDTYIYYSWANSVYSFGSNVVKVSNSEFRYSGGASIHYDNIEENLSNAENTNKVIYHYNSLTGESEELSMTKKATLDIDQRTQLVNWVNGSEIWFQLYDMSSLSGQLLAGMQGYVAGSTVNGDQSNMYSVVKSYSRLSEGDTAYTSDFSGEYGGNTQLFNFAVIYREKTSGSGEQVLYHNIPEAKFRNSQTAVLDTTITRLPMYTDGGDGSFQTFARMNANGISKPILDAAGNPLPMYCYPVSRYSGFVNSTQDVGGGVTGNSLAQALSTYQGYTGNKALLVGAGVASNEGTFYTESAYAYGLSEHGILNHDGTSTNYGWLEVGLDYPGVMNCFIYTYYYNGYDIIN